LPQEAQSSLEKWLSPPAAAQVRAEQAPPWPADDEETSPLAEPNPRVWQTYSAERAERARHLQKLALALRAAPENRTLATEVLQTLHILHLAARVAGDEKARLQIAQLKTRLLSALDDIAGWPWPQIEALVAGLTNVA
jgi:hypothetical protein